MGGWDNSPENGGGGWISTIGGLALMIAVAFAIAMCSQFANAQEPDLVGVASVIDGDTIEIHGRRVRLDGIDAPESGARCGRTNIYREAANALAAQISERTLHCAITGYPTGTAARLYAAASVEKTSTIGWSARAGRAIGHAIVEVGTLWPSRKRARRSAAYGR